MPSFSFGRSFSKSRRSSRALGTVDEPRACRIALLEEPLARTNFKLRVRQVDFRLLARHGGCIRAGRLLRFECGRKIRARPRDVDFILGKRGVCKHGDFIGQRLNEPFARRQLEPARRAVFEHVGPQNTGFERRKKRRMRG